MTERISILIVEDEEAPLEALVMLARYFGMSPKTAGSVWEVRQLIEQGYTPDTALVDLRIPQGGAQPSVQADSNRHFSNGIVAAELILKEHEHCRIIISSALKGMRESVQRVGVWGYVSKLSSGVPVIKMLTQGPLLPSEIGQPTKLITPPDDV